MPVREETADAIDAHIRPKMEAVLDAAEGDTEPLMKAWLMASRPKRTIIQEGPDAARRFEGAMDRLLRVSKEELARREAEYQESRKNKPRHEPKSGER